MNGERLLCYKQRALFPLGLVAVAVLAAGLAFVLGGGQKGVDTAHAQRAGIPLVSNLEQADSATAPFSITSTARAQTVFAATR